jgi:ribosomal protection tetracycline resistance protein
LREVAEKLTPAIVPMGAPRALGTRTAGFAPHGPTDEVFTTRLAEILTDHDDGLLAACVDDATSVSYDRLRTVLAAQTKAALLHPLYFGSARTGVGIDALIAGITELLPTDEGDVDGPPSGVVFKIERGRSDEAVAYVRMFSGTVRVRDRLDHGAGKQSKVSAIRVFDRGSAVQRESVSAGQIGQLWGLSRIQIGDAVGLPSARQTVRQHFAPPTLETVVLPRRPGDKGALNTALTQLAEQDPLINLRHDDLRQETTVSLYGEVQKEVIQATLATEYGVEVTFRETTTICIERPVGVGEAFEVIGKEPNPFLATVGLRIEPAPIDSGVRFQLEVELGSMPRAFFTAVEEAVYEAQQQGLRGWQVTDCTVTMTHSGYAARQSHAGAGFDKSMSSTAGDFRSLTALVLMDALKQAGTAVCEPIHRFRLDVPADTLGVVAPALAHAGAVPDTSRVRGATGHLEGDIPAAQVHRLERVLPSLTRGEGILDCAFDHYRQVRGTAPTRP